MKNYEIVLIFHPGNSNLVTNILEKYINFIKENKGIVHRLENWGRRHLSYPIKKIHKGHYVLINIEMLKDTMKILENKIRFDENILRNLIISVKNPILNKSPMFLIKDAEKKLKNSK
ncbi:30S ribosomal protein S6 [Buchnera aphidicola (Pseudoregma panicola)]|uniref:30S ribosomal protein S6 n=1 Tax=Buchnera aphidicola TaxID=9 RepID=UPI0031B6F5A3